MSISECKGCEYDGTCFHLLKVKQSLTTKLCGNFRKKKTFKPKEKEHDSVGNPG